MKLKHVKGTIYFAIRGSSADWHLFVARPNDVDSHRRLYGSLDRIETMLTCDFMLSATKHCEREGCEKWIFRISTTQAQRWVRTGQMPKWEERIKTK